MAFFVGEKAEPFGVDPERLTGPRSRLQSTVLDISVEYAAAKIEYSNSRSRCSGARSRSTGAVFVAFEVERAGRIAARVGNGESSQRRPAKVLRREGAGRRAVPTRSGSGMLDKKPNSSADPSPNVRRPSR